MPLTSTFAANSTKLMQPWNLIEFVKYCFSIVKLKLDRKIEWNKNVSYF